MTVSFKLETLTPSPDPQVEAMLKTHHELMRSSSPPGSCHVFDLSGLQQSDVKLWSLREGRLVQTVGAWLNLGEGRAELKSMHTRAEARGKGFGLRLLEHILADAYEHDVHTVLLETGSESLAGFQAAHRLYLNYGFEICPPFGDYVADPNSCFMRLAL